MRCTLCSFKTRSYTTQVSCTVWLQVGVITFLQLSRQSLQYLFFIRVFKRGSVISINLATKMFRGYIYNTNISEHQEPERRAIPLALLLSIQEI